MRKEAIRWLEQAKIDFKSATVNFEQKVYYVASFLSQQAVEKALKAILIEKDRLIPKVHDLVFLAKKAGIDGDLLSRCDELAKVYLETRYPDISKEKPSDIANVLNNRTFIHTFAY